MATPTQRLITATCLRLAELEQPANRRRVGEILKRLRDDPAFSSVTWDDRVQILVDATLTPSGPVIATVETPAFWLQPDWLVETYELDPASIPPRLKMLVKVDAHIGRHRVFQVAAPPRLIPALAVVIATAQPSIGFGDLVLELVPATPGNPGLEEVATHMAALQPVLRMSGNPASEGAISACAERALSMEAATWVSLGFFTQPRTMVVTDSDGGRDYDEVRASVGSEDLAAGGAVAMHVGPLVPQGGYRNNGYNFPGCLEVLAEAVAEQVVAAVLDESADPVEVHHTIYDPSLEDLDVLDFDGSL